MSKFRKKPSWPSSAWTPDPLRMNNRKSSGKTVISDTSSFLRFLLVLIAGAVLLRIFVVQAYQIPSASMEDTLQVGDFLIGNTSMCKMYTEYGFRDADAPLIAAQTTWEIDSNQPGKRINEVHIYWLCVGIEEPE